MAKALPSKLPECFHWAQESSRQRLFLDNVEILEVRQQRLGWVVQVHLNDSMRPHPLVVVRSVDAGMRWGARWSKVRAPQLIAMAARRRRLGSRTVATMHTGGRESPDASSAFHDEGYPLRNPGAQP